jgi:hypothetical protein
MLLKLILLRVGVAIGTLVLFCLAALGAFWLYDNINYIF